MQKKKELIEDVIQAIKNNEAIVATDVLVKNEIMAGAWTIEDDYKINRCQSESLSNQWTKNTAIAVEAITTLDLLSIWVTNLKVM